MRERVSSNSCVHSGRSVCPVPLQEETESLSDTEHSFGSGGEAILDGGLPFLSPGDSIPANHVSSQDSPPTYTHKTSQHLEY